MRKQLENDLIVALMPYLNMEHIADAKLAITITVGNYDILQEETSLTVYEGDINEMIIRRWLSAKIAKGCSERTINYYRNSVKYSLEKIGKPYQDITADDVRLYLATRIHKDKVSKTTANNERRNLSSFYCWLQKEEILLKNPMNKIDVIKETKKKRKAFSPMELEQIRYACRTKRETAIVETLMSTWCRVSELCEVKISDIRGDTLTIHGKGDKFRDCFLNAKANLAIQKYLEERKDTNPFLFPRAKYAGNVAEMAKGNKRKKQAGWYKDPKLVDDSRHIDYGTIESIVRNIGRRAGVADTHPHRFRRTGATMALRNGMSIIKVSKMLGHEQIDTTQIYLDISDEELMQAHRKYVT